MLAFRVIGALQACSVCSLSRAPRACPGRVLNIAQVGHARLAWERGGVKGFGLSLLSTPLTPTLSPNGERERTALVAAPSNRARWGLGLLSAFALALACGPALAQTSQKPIQIIVPFAPGASADGAARIVALLPTTSKP